MGDILQRTFVFIVSFLSYHISLRERNDTGPGIMPEMIIGFLGYTNIATIFFVLAL